MFAVFTELWYRRNVSLSVKVKTSENRLPKKAPGAVIPPEKGRFLSRSRGILSMAYDSGFRNDPPRPDGLANVDLDFEMDLLSLAYDLSEKAHEGIVRRNGDPYFSHPVSVAKILLEDFPNPTTFKVIV